VPHDYVRTETWRRKRRSPVRKRSKIYLAAAAATVVAAAAGTGIAAAGGAGDDAGDEVSITGAALGRASTAALVHTGGGRVTETEKGDEESLYEVEVTLEDGSQVDVQLDADFTVVGDEADNDAGEDGEGEG
jgi:uncharacterized membrane protein YkoI